MMDKTEKQCFSAQHNDVFIHWVAFSDVSQKNGQGLGIDSLQSSELQLMVACVESWRLDKDLCQVFIVACGFV